MDSLRVRELALELASFGSVTDGPGEGAFGPFLAGILRDSPALAGREDCLRVLPTLDDRRERFLVFGLVRGSGRDTVMLTGHYDVVGIEAYGSLRELAFDPERLTRALMEELGANRAAALSRDLPPSPSEEQALADLEGGDFLAGRGLLDMKAGLAAGIAVLERFAADPGRRGNLLFMAVPDEEGSSAGMRSAARLLPTLLEEWGLELRLSINMDSAVDQIDGEGGRAVFFGSVGKTHPFVLFRGRPTHAAAPFDGVNPSLLAAEFVRRVECAPSLIGSRPEDPDRPEGEVPPPPTVLYHRDLRTSYEVTSPASVFTSLNVLTHEARPGDILARVEALALEAIDAGVELLEARARQQSRLSGLRVEARTAVPRILRWTELEAKVLVRNRRAFEAAQAAALAAPDPIPALASLVDACLDLSGLEGPLAVVGFAPPYYPRAAFGPEDAALETKLAAEIEAFSRDRGVQVCRRPFFPGISDMSFLSSADPPEDRQESAVENPLGGVAALSAFRCPAINAGPWGRDYHQKLERLHLGYAFEELPELVFRLASRTLA